MSALARKVCDDRGAGSGSAGLHAPRGCGVPRSAAVLERRRRQEGDRRLRRQGDDARVRPTSCRRRSASRRSTTTARSGPSSRCISSSLFALDRVKALAPQHPEWKTKEPFASLLEGDMKARSPRGREGRHGDHRGHPRGHDDRRVRRRSSRTGSPPRSIQAPAALHGDGLPADARAARVSARERLQDLHRLGRRHRVHAPVDGEGLRHSARAGRSAAAVKTEVRDARRQAGADQAAGSQLHRRQGGQAGRHPAATSAAARSPPSATPTATSRCSNGRRPEKARASACSSTTTTPKREFAYDRADAARKLDKALERSDRAEAGPSSA